MEPTDNLNEDLAGVVEAMLFISNEPLSILTMAQILEVAPSQVRDALLTLQQAKASQHCGVLLEEVAGGWRLSTDPAYHETLEKLVLSWDTRKLSAAALEVLAIVAYGQPLTRAQISDIRGVNSDSTVATLVERGLLREAGVANAPGNPVLYATSKSFLEKFGLTSPKDLPPLEEYAPDEATVALIKERLGATQQLNDESALEEANVDGADADQGDAADGLGAAGGNAGLAAGLTGQLTAASLFDVVDKIDFDTLVFDTDDE